MLRLISRLFGAHSNGSASTKARKVQLELENLEARLVPASYRGAVVDFTGGEIITQQQMKEGGWTNDPAQAVPGFTVLFDKSRTWLDLNADKVVNQLDANIAISRIMAKVRQDYAPYNVTIAQGRQADSQGVLTNPIIGDAIVMVTSGSYFRPGEGQPFGISPPGWDDGNLHDEIVWAFGGTIASNSFFQHPDRFINAVAQTISHELGHAFGLEHVFVDGTDDMLNHHMMGAPLPPNANGTAGADGRDYTRDFTFPDKSYPTTADGTTLTGRNQNAHHYLLHTLGPSGAGSAVVLSPGTLSVFGTNFRDNIYVTRTPYNQWQVTMNNVTQFVGLVSVNTESFNPFDTPIQRVLIDALSGDDAVTISAAFNAETIVHGNEGNDTIMGGSGRDFLYGDNGWDTIYGGGNDDFLDGGDKDDFLSGEGGLDTIHGGGGNDNLDGGHDGYADILLGDSGSDTFVKHLVKNGNVWSEEYDSTDFRSGEDKTEEVLWLPNVYNFTTLNSRGQLLVGI